MATTSLQDGQKDALNGKRILLGISGGIAAYKAPQLVRLLRQADADVQVVMTRGANHLAAKAGPQDTTSTLLWAVRPIVRTAPCKCSKPLYTPG